MMTEPRPNTVFIVYYAPRKEKTWTVQNSCKSCKHELWAGQFLSRGSYTIFCHTGPKNTTFSFLRRERMWYFRPGYNEKKVINSV